MALFQTLETNMPCISCCALHCFAVSQASSEWMAIESWGTPPKPTRNKRQILRHNLCQALLLLSCRWMGNPSKQRRKCKRTTCLESVATSTTFSVLPQTRTLRSFQNLCQENAPCELPRGRICQIALWRAHSREEAPFKSNGVSSRSKKEPMALFNNLKFARATSAEFAWSRFKILLARA